MAKRLPAGTLNGKGRRPSLASVDAFETALKDLVIASGNAHRAAGAEPARRRSVALALLAAAARELQQIQDLEPERAARAARVIDGLVAATDLDAERPRVGAEVGAKALTRAAQRLWKVAGDKSRIVSPDEKLRIGRRIRERVLKELMGGNTEPRTLAIAVEVGRTAPGLLGATGLLFPDVPLDAVEAARGGVVARWEQAIVEKVESFRSNGRSKDPVELASRIVEVCSLAAGYKRASEIFQGELKAEDRNSKVRPDK